MNNCTKLAFICFSFLFYNTAYTQLMNHGDSDFAQFNLYGKYINESNNVISIIQSSLSDADSKKELQDNFDITLYHLPKLTLIDRFTCELAHASIKSNSRRMEGEVHENMYNDLKALRTVEGELNDYILSNTNNLKNFEAISSNDLLQKFKNIIDKQQIIIDKLNKQNSTYVTPKFYNDIRQIYTDFTDILCSKTDDKTISIDRIHQLIDGFDFTPIEKWDYPKGMLVAAFDQIKAALKSNLTVHDIYKQNGIPQMLNKVLLIYKNNNKEDKFIDLMNPPLNLE